jgi:hypothetical protein
LTRDRGRLPGADRGPDAVAWHWHPWAMGRKHSVRACVALLLAIAVGAVAACTRSPERPPPRPTPTPPGFVALFNGRDLNGWRAVIAGKEAAPAPAFTVHDGMIVVSGDPTGYLATRQSYRNFVVRYDWKFTDRAGGNSGLLVFIQQTSHAGPWPTCVEVQGMQSEHGSIFPIEGARGTFSTDKEAIARAVRPGEWNTTEVTAQDGKLTSTVNGVRVASGAAEIDQGPLGWQSEGAELHLRNIELKTG